MKLLKELSIADLLALRNYYMRFTQVLRKDAIENNSESIQRLIVKIDKKLLAIDDAFEWKENEISELYEINK